MDYDSMDSGLEFGISKNKANSINYKLNLDTNLEKGTKINMNIPLINSSNIFNDRESILSNNEGIKLKNSISNPYDPI